MGGSWREGWRMTTSAPLGAPVVSSTRSASRAWLRIARRELAGGLGGFWIYLACLTLGAWAIAAAGSVTWSCVRPSFSLSRFKASPSDLMYVFAFIVLMVKAHRQFSCLFVCQSSAVSPSECGTNKRTGKMC